MDVSDTSPDHAVTLEPLLTERVEVLRGPSTLLYGSSAIGGAVNVIGKEMPRQRVDPKGYEGALEARRDTVSGGDTLAGYATVGDDDGLLVRRWWGEKAPKGRILKEGCQLLEDCGGIVLRLIG